MPTVTRSAAQAGSPPSAILDIFKDQRRRARSLAVSRSAPICAFGIDTVELMLRPDEGDHQQRQRPRASPTRGDLAMRLDELHGLLLALERRRDAHVHDGPLRLRGLRRLVERIYTFSKSPRTSPIIESRFAVAKPSFFLRDRILLPQGLARRIALAVLPATSCVQARRQAADCVGASSAVAVASTMESLVIIMEAC